MARNNTGRHRAPGFNPFNELGDIAAKSAQPAMKVSAVAVASGGLVAAFAIPASAAPVGDNAKTLAATSAGLVPNGAQSAATQGVAIAAPAVDPAAAPAFGVVGFSGKAAEKPSEAVLEIKRVQPAAPARASRSAARTPAAAAVVNNAPAVDAPAPSAGGIIGIAQKYSGIPYRYGGTTPSGFDCSGYTGYVFGEAGISLPRTAEGQRQAATQVSNPVPGDLVFFGFPAYHVGIYAGGGQLYDSPRTGSYSGLHSIWTSKDVSYGRF